MLLYSIDALNKSFGVLGSKLLKGLEHSISLRSKPHRF